MGRREQNVHYQLQEPHRQRGNVATPASTTLLLPPGETPQPHPLILPRKLCPHLGGWGLSQKSPLHSSSPPQELPTPSIRRARDSIAACRFARLFSRSHWKPKPNRRTDKVVSTVCHWPDRGKLRGGYLIESFPHEVMSERVSALLSSTICAIPRRQEH